MNETESQGALLSMDYPTRNEFEHYCALAEIAVGPDEFMEIRRNIIRVLDEKQARLNRGRPTARVPLIEKKAASHDETSAAGIHRGLGKPLI